jgi:hypothetical protein
MDLTQIWDFINQGFPSSVVGGVISTQLSPVIEKVKNHFLDNAKPTKKEFDSLIMTNDQFRSLITDMAGQINKPSTTTQNIGVMNVYGSGEVKATGHITTQNNYQK